MAISNTKAKALKFISEKGGIIIEDRDALSVDYVWVVCANGHEWRVQYVHLANQHWCASCYGNNSLTIENMQELARARGGLCLSSEYRGLKNPLKWECVLNHQWDATPNNVKNKGSWCPHCKFNIGEEITRTAFEYAFPGHKFAKTRKLPWMNKLELDGYNDELKLAFEYQGIQHYKHTKYFQKDQESFETQLHRDNLTRERCDENEVTLIEVSYLIPHKNIQSFVYNELKTLGYDITDTDVNIVDIARAKPNDPHYDRLIEVIKNKGGICLSDSYKGYKIPVKIQCKKGHIFEASLEAIDQPEERGPRFCPECGGTSKKPDSVLKDKVEACGYKFLGVESRNDGKRSRRYITVICPKGHQYDTLWDNFNPTDNEPRKKCAECHYKKMADGKRFDVTEWSLLTGIHILNEYKNLTTPCMWRCSNGHEFQAKLFDMRNRKTGYCSICTINDYAAANNLLIDPSLDLSNDISSTQQIQFNCKCGTKFEFKLNKLTQKINCVNCTSN